MVSNQFANAHHHHHHQHAAANQGGKLIATYPPSFHALRYANLILLSRFYWICWFSDMLLIQWLQLECNRQRLSLSWQMLRQIINSNNKILSSRQPQHIPATISRVSTCQVSMESIGHRCMACTYKLHQFFSKFTSLLLYPSANFDILKRSKFFNFFRMILSLT